MTEPLIKKHATCSICRIEYKTAKWFLHDSKNTICLFCTHYLPMRNTKFDLLNDIKVHYYATGEYSITEYYKEYLDSVNKWCEKWHIQTLQNEKVLEELLRAERDWTREYWY